MKKYPRFVALKLPDELVEQARQQAESDDRTLSNHLRRIITEGVKRHAPTQDAAEDADSRRG